MAGTDIHLINTQTPVQSIDEPLFQSLSIRLSIKREDLNDKEIQGNKWLKLKSNLEQARQQGYKSLLTFGGCYSNHIYATAAAGRRFGFNTIGIIRGPEPKQLSPTLNFALQAGMQLHFLNRLEYRNIHDTKVQQRIIEPFLPAYIIPEGGSNQLAVNSCADYASTLPAEYDVISCACGTGGTLAGLIKGSDSSKSLLGIPVLKGAEFLFEDISNFLKTDISTDKSNNWTLNTNYHFGGYAKSSAELEDFIVAFYHSHGIKLEPVYTGKMMYALYDLIKKGYFEKNSRILAIHSGGIQGLDGFPELKKRLE